MILNTPINHDHTLFPDMINTKFSEWTSWSECSRTCIKDYENLPYKRRSRTCHPYCKKHIGTEEEACVDLPMCNNGNK